MMMTMKLWWSRTSEDWLHILHKRCISSAHTHAQNNSIELTSLHWYQDNEYESSIYNNSIQIHRETHIILACWISSVISFKVDWQHRTAFSVLKMGQGKRYITSYFMSTVLRSAIKEHTINEPSFCCQILHSLAALDFLEGRIVLHWYVKSLWRVFNFKQGCVLCCWKILEIWGISRLFGHNVQWRNGAQKGGPC